METAIKSPYRNSHFFPAVCKVQQAFKAATKRIESTAHLVVIPVLDSNHFGTVCIVHPEDMMLEFVVRPTTFVVVVVQRSWWEKRGLRLDRQDRVRFVSRWPEGQIWVATAICIQQVEARCLESYIPRF